MRYIFFSKPTSQRTHREDGQYFIASTITRYRCLIFFSSAPKVRHQIPSIELSKEQERLIRPAPFSIRRAKVAGEKLLRYLSRNKRNIFYTLMVIAASWTPVGPGSREISIPYDFPIRESEREKERRWNLRGYFQRRPEWKSRARTMGTRKSYIRSRWPSRVPSLDPLAVILRLPVMFARHGTRTRRYIQLE